MKYYVTNNIHVVEIPVKDFSVVMVDARKRTAAKENYCNAGFFGTYHENGSAFTLPAGHLVCDYKATNQYNKKYCQERGKFISDNKFQFDSSKWSYMNQFYKKSLSTLLVKDSIASIQDIVSIPSGYDYAITGVPIMNNGQDVKFNTYVKGQGWNGSSLYGTWHIFVGLKQDRKIIYIMGMKTTSGNMILSAEAYKKFKALGMYDVIKLDGGGSAFMNVNGKNIINTSENRRINTIICWNNNSNIIVQNKEGENKNPFPIPTTTLKKGNKYTNYNKWLQWQLNKLGFNCGNVDGSFGPGTLKQVLAFQKSRKLVQDGFVGPATRKALME